MNKSCVVLLLFRPTVKTDFNKTLNHKTNKILNCSEVVMFQKI